MHHLYVTDTVSKMAMGLLEPTVLRLLEREDRWERLPNSWRMVESGKLGGRSSCSEGSMAWKPASFAAFIDMAQYEQPSAA